jgi:tRNA modification GTPase
VLDTAGIRETDDPVEREGVRRARDQAAQASLVLWVEDATEYADGPLTPVLRCGVPAAEASRGAPARADPLPAKREQGAEPHSVSAGVWRIVNKVDLLPLTDRAKLRESENVYFVSSTIGTGISELLNAIRNFCEGFFSPEPALVTRERQRGHLNDTAAAIRNAKEAAAQGREEIVAEHLRLATRSLGKLLGRVDVEDILDIIFRDFCIGK